MYLHTQHDSYPEKICDNVLHVMWNDWLDL